MLPRNTTLQRLDRAMADRRGVSTDRVRVRPRKGAGGR